MARPKTTTGSSEPQVGGSANPTIRRALRLIESKACQGLTVEELAGSLRVSRSTLKREFELELAKTPAQMIRLVRLRRAGELLAGTDLLVKQVARQVGFERTGNFYAFFRDHFGQSPSVFRRSAEAQATTSTSRDSLKSRKMRTAV